MFAKTSYKPQPWLYFITLLSENPFPLHILLVIDVSGHMLTSHKQSLQDKEKLVSQDINFNSVNEHYSN